MANLFQGQAPQQQEQQEQQVAAPAADGEVVCVDLSMRASSLQGFAGDLQGRLRAASSLNSAVVKAVNKPALSSTDVLVGFYDGGRVQLSVTVPESLESEEVIKLLGEASGALEGSVTDADMRTSGKPYKKEADISASAATTEAPSADGEEKRAKTQVKAAKAKEEKDIKTKDQEESGSQDPQSGGNANKLVVLLCAVAGIAAAILIAALLPGGSGAEPAPPGLRPSALSTASSGVVRYAASDVDLTRPL